MDWGEKKDKTPPDAHVVVNRVTITIRIRGSSHDLSFDRVRIPLVTKDYLFS